MQRKVLSVASEAYPLIKTGGLADVVGALPAALAVEGVQVRTLLPGYPAVMAAFRADADPIELAGTGTLRSGRAADLDIFVLDAPSLYARAGNPYLASDGRDWQDNAQRFAALARAGAAIARGAVAGWVPDVVHAHDWQAGLVAAYLRFGRADRSTVPSVLTVHNMAFPGIFPATVLRELSLPAAAFTTDGIEYYGQISFLKAGLALSDVITTVSPTYAREILGPAEGMGFDGLLNARQSRLHGILNGIDTTVWNPATDAAIAARFTTGAGKAANKAALQTEFDLIVDAGPPLFGVISRLTTQKGLDLLAAAVPVLLDAGAQLVVLGSGDAAIEAAFIAATERHPGRIACRLGYDEALAHRIQAGADALLVPSRFEPCGLTQLCALRYGTIPVVSRVGGLADTVVDANAMAVASGVATGVQFAPVTRTALEAAIRRTATLHADPGVWTTMRDSAMGTDVSWANPARAYAKLYAAL